MTPEKLGPYRIEQVLGRGGMGTVYSAVNKEDGSRVAVKLLSAAYADDDHFRKRFEAEIEAMIQLKHPNIVEILAFGEEHGQLYYAMELVEGSSLFDELKSGRQFHWREVARMGIDICAALRHAHDHGIIHRDLKPGNLLLEKSGCVKLTDFGIAKLFGRRQMTVEGGVMGTADYMSPEQAQGVPVTTRSDLYSLGGVLYALLARRPPFASKSVVELMKSLSVDTPPPVGQFATGVPAEFEQMISKLLEKDPQKRIGAALGVANRLKAILAEVKDDDPVRDGIDDQDFDIADSDPDQTVGHRPAIHGAPTAPSLGAGKWAAAPDAATRSPLIQAKTSALSEAGKQPPASLKPATPNSHFTTVDEEKRKQLGSRFDVQQTLEPSVLRRIMLPGLLLALVIVLGVLGVLYAPPLTRPTKKNDDDRTQDAAASQPAPLSDDQLYETIAAAQRRGRVDEVEQQIDHFLETYADDQRAAEVHALRELLPAYRFLQRMRGAVQSVDSMLVMRPFEIDFVEALAHVASDPQQAGVELSFFASVYDEGNKTPAEIKVAIQAAEIQNKLLRDQLTHRGDDLAARLNRVRELLKDGDTLRAENQLRAITILYAGKPFAEQSVAEAQRMLVEIGEENERQED